MEILFNERVFRSKIKNYRKLNKIILDKIDYFHKQGKKTLEYLRSFFLYNSYVLYILYGY